ncbi:LOW QUALITY PROTEIN: uncharacterized protein ACNS7B_005297 [Menidia menidia]
MEPEVLPRFSSSPPPLEDGLDDEDDFGDFGAFSGVPSSASFSEFATPTTFNQTAALSASSPPALLVRAPPGATEASKANGEPPKANGEPPKANGVLPGRTERAPLTNEPLTNEPLTNEPLTNEPLTNETLTNEPLTNEPLTNEPLTNEPLTNEPLTNEPLTNEPLTNGFLGSGPPSQEATPPEDDFADFAAFSGGQTASDGAGRDQRGHAPQEQGHAPQERGHAPQEQGHAPQEQGEQGHAPQEQGHAPQERGHAPQEQGKQGHAPQERGHAPQEQGYAPQEQGHAPQEQGHAPQEQGHAPQERGHAPQEQGHAPQEQGKQGHAPQEQGHAPDGTPGGSRTGSPCPRGSSPLRDGALNGGEALAGVGGELSPDDKGSETETSLGRPLSADALEEFADASTPGSAPLGGGAASPEEDGNDFADFGDAAGGETGFADFQQLDVQRPPSPMDANQDSTRQDGARQDGGEQDGARHDGGELDGALHDGGELDGARHDGGGQDGARHDGGELDGARHDGGELDGARHDGGGQDGARHDGGELDGARHDGGELDGARHDGGEQDDARHDGGKQDSARNNGGERDGAQQDGGELEDDFGDFNSPRFQSGAEDGAGFPGSDSFGNFSCAQDGELENGEQNGGGEQDDGGGWNAFGETPGAEEEESWAEFTEPSGAERREEEAVTKETSSMDQQTVSLAGRLEKLFQISFPPSAPRDQPEQRVASLQILLEPPQNQPEGGGPCRRARGGVWAQLQDIHEALGLRYQWGGSHCNKKLLCCLGIDTRNILFTGQKKQPVIVPMYAAGLGMLEPTKQPAPPVSAAELIASIATSPPPPPPGSPPDPVQEALPPVQFDWSSSGLTNPLDASGGSSLLNLDFFGPVEDLVSSSSPSIPGVDPELYELTTVQLDPSSRVADAFARLMSTMETTSTRRSRREEPQGAEPLSEEASAVIGSLPDLSFMQAKVLMFPSTLTAR